MRTIARWAATLEVAATTAVLGFSYWVVHTSIAGR